MKSSLLCLLCCGIFVSTAYGESEKLKVLYEWKFFDFVFINKYHRQDAIESGNYNYTKITSIDTDRAPDGRTFVTVIRDEGVPASLTTVSYEVGPGGPLLNPYPSWAWYLNSKCSGFYITSVYRVTINCGKLYVLDTGKIGEKTVCPPQILVFDLETDKLEFRRNIPPHIALNQTGAGLLVTPVVYNRDGCNMKRNLLIMANVDGRALATYDFETEEFHRLLSPTFGPDPKSTNITISGQSFVLPDGVLGLTIAYPRSNEPQLWYCALASRNLNMVYISDVIKADDTNQSQYHTLEDILPCQPTVLTFSSSGLIFIGLTTETAIGCYNPRSKALPSNVGILVKDSEKLQFVSGLKTTWCPKRHLEGLLMMSNRFQKAFTGTMNFSEINFRILTGYVKPLLRQSTCLD